MGRPPKKAVTPETVEKAAQAAVEMAAVEEAAQAAVETKAAKEAAQAEVAEEEHYIVPEAVKEAVERQLIVITEEIDNLTRKAKELNTFMEKYR